MNRSHATNLIASRIRTKIHLAAIGSVIAITAVILFAAQVEAATPGQVSYQGLLLDSGGLPVTGVVSIDATLFDALPLC